MDRILKDRWYWTTLLVGVAMFYVLNLYTALWGDDILYKLIPGNETKWCDSIQKYLASMPYFYQDTNGRIADMLERFITCFVGKGIFNVLNTLVFAVLVHQVARFVSRGSHSVLALSAVYVFILLVFPNPGQTTLWMAGAINYLWGCTANVLLLMYMKRCIDNRRSSSPWWHHVLVALCAFVAGGMNESISFAMAAGMACYFVLYRKELRGTMATLVVAYMLGVMLIVLSPAAWNRLESGNSVNFNMGVMQLLLRRSYNLVMQSVKFVTPVLGLLAVAFACRRRGLKEASHNLLYWMLVGTVASVLVLGVGQARAYSWYALLGFIVSARAVVPLLQSRRRLCVMLCAVFSVVNIVCTAVALKTSIACRQYCDMAEGAVMASPDGVVKAFPVMEKSRYCQFMVYNNEKVSCFNGFMSTYYGKSNVQFLPDSVYTRYKNPKPFIDDAVLLPHFQSSHPELASEVYLLADARISVVPFKVDWAWENQGFSGKIYYKDTYAARGRAFARYPQYHVMREGKRYVVLPALSDSIALVEIYTKVRGVRDTLTFTYK